MSTIRAEKFTKLQVGFTTVLNPVVEDARLTFKAMGVLVYLLSRPDHWRPNYRQLMKTHLDGEKSVRAALRELEAAGYYSRKRVRHEDGSFGWETTVSDQPCLGYPCLPNAGLVDGGLPKVGSSQDGGAKTEESREVEAKASPSPRMEPSSFDAFWEAYPKKVGKGEARRAYAKALRKIEENVILSAVNDYAASRRGQEKRYTANPATWLNQERWEDEVQTNSRVGILPDAPIPEWYQKVLERRKEEG
jgi:hypothetical protein